MRYISASIISLAAVCVASTVMVSPSRADDLAIAQIPLFESANFPPMNMIVMGRDHSLYYPAYNDASDLTGNGVPDVGYKPLEIDYYGLFDSFKCYSYQSSGGRFVPTGASGANKTCGSGWSGDFLNWVTTSRIDALRKVLYGGKRSVDEEDETVLERSYVPQDAHSWGKEYQSPERDGYNISEYTPLSQPGSGRYHLFANTSLTGSPDRPRMRVLRNTGFRVWEWTAIERPVAGNRCLDGGSGPFCTSDAAGMDDYTVRVEVCDESAPLGATCQRYPDGNYKPVGLLQEFGESGRMHFGLITGSYLRNMSGGVLRRAMANISDEFDSDTGQFTDVEGIVSTINKFKVVGLQSDNAYHPGWPNAWLTQSRMDEGDFPDWGNPIGEMMYESLRYFAGKAEPTPAYMPSLSSGKESVTARLGDNIELPAADWDDPFESRAYCTAGAQLVISNTNVSHDGDEIPGSAFGSFSGDLSGFNAASLADEIWSMEVGGSRQHFIGQSGGQSDDAPTVKTVNGLGDVRGLSPQEPTKEGTYYTASAARFGAYGELRDDLEENPTLETFSVALASQLPRIEFPVGGDIVTMVPFGKSVNGCEGANPDRDGFQPMAQIVDFFVEEWANTDESNMDEDVNGGRPYASFRINFEDVEQAADHDMDGIVRYEIAVTTDGEVEVSLTPEYYAGCIKMNVGYVISGVTSEFDHPVNPGETVEGPADGMYLEVRGDPGAGENMSYYLNTPPGVPPGACAAEPVPPQYSADCNSAPGLPPDNMGEAVTRVFEPSSSSAGTVMRDPLWWAAKYGNTDNEDLSPGETPDNYYLVTNAATLSQQLNEAFTRILDLAETAGLVTSSTRLDTDSFIYASEFDSTDWSGELKALNATDGTVAKVATEELDDLGHDNRQIFTFLPEDGAGEGEGVEFLATGDVVSDLTERLALDGSVPEIDLWSVENVIGYIRGDDENEGEGFRPRSVMMGDIVNSRPTFSGAGNEGWGRVDDEYLEYIAEEKNDPRDCPEEGTCLYDREDTVFVGANDGMLHAFDGRTLEEYFAYVPAANHHELWRLADPDYTHRYYVDGQVSVGDAKIESDWGTYLVGTLGAGGRGVYALDVTDPKNFTEENVLWELTADDDPDIGFTFGKPLVTRLGDGTWVAIFGNGYNSQLRKAYLFVVGLETGEILQKIPVGDADSNGLSGVAGWRDPVEGSHVRRVYAGDLDGTMWRFDFDEEGEGSVALEDGLFEGDRAITSSPSLTAHPSGGLMVLYGTGKFIEASDRLDTSTERFYGIRDLNETVDENELSEINMQEAPSEGEELPQRSLEGDGSGAGGWFVELKVDSEKGERVLVKPQVGFAGRVNFTTFQPVDDPCEPGGIQRPYFLNVITGGGRAIEIGTGAPIAPPIGIKPPSGGPGIGDIPYPGDPDPGDPGDPGFPPAPDPTGGDPEGWCSEVGIPPLSEGGEFMSLGQICEGRQVWRQLQ